MLNFLQKFGIFCFLDNNEYEFDKSYECIAGAGILQSIVAKQFGYFSEINEFQKLHKDWVFGHLSYDIKNEIEDLHSLNPDGIKFPEYFFFVPEIVFIISGNELQIGICNSFNTDNIHKQIISCSAEINKYYNRAEIKSRFTKNEYITTVKKLQEHILRGDCYEINFCQEFYINETEIDPLFVYSQLTKLSPSPFSAFYKYQDRFLLCSSPERFLKKAGNTVISQPIKGTSERIINDAKADDELKKNLLNNDKERSENIMIVDLVRNDLAKICAEGSVFVKDFLKVYSFPHVHQMISTISGTLKNNISLADVFKATFPMGSMTGAPKKRVMELIEMYEKTKRGLFSGSVGYINPEGNFDFNVVIRSILYNSSEKYLSIQAGSAITFKSVPEKEYEECLLKIAALRNVLA
jgi:para-aminobenzoate synthetase component 1